MSDLTLAFGMITLSFLWYMAFRPKEMKVLRVHLDPGAKAPRQANPHAAGYDLFCLEEAVLAPHQTKVLNTGVRMEIPCGMVGLVRPRGSAQKRGLAIQGTIDSDYRGEVMVVVHNTANFPQIVGAGTAVAQVTLVEYAHLPVVEVADLSSTERGEGRFGSTGNT